MDHETDSPCWAPLFQVDAFAERPYAGNPAAVCLLPPSPPQVASSSSEATAGGGAGGSSSKVGTSSAHSPMDDKSRLLMAAEMNLSETAFVEVPDLAAADRVVGDPFVKLSRFTLRWFTPVTEVALCGHATLATAGTLFYGLGNTNKSITFDTLSGELSVARAPEFGATGVAMTFPANPAIPVSEGPVLDIYKIIAAAACDHNLVSCLAYSEGTKKLIVRLKDECTRAQLEAIEPSQSGMHSVDQTSLPDSSRVTGVSITLKAPESNPEGLHFYSRYFTPWNGIAEDPVNGSSHTALAPYWATELGITELYALQCSKRTGRLALQTTVKPDCTLVGDHSGNAASWGAVVIGGPVSIVLEGRVKLPRK